MKTPVNFQISKLLKEKGFDVPVRTYRLEGKYSDFVHEGFEDDYWGDNKVVNWNQDVIGIKPFKGFVSAPTIAEVVKWLYDKHEIFVTVNIPYEEFGKFSAEIWGKNLDDGIKILLADGMSVFDSIENAYEEGIEHCLTNEI